tara:strand:+ start:17844 stop:18671 length:828 start_codon:yes stop_codon:yes gene_type:complete
METYCQIATDLENDLSGLRDISDKFPEQIEYATGRCKLALDHLHELVLKKGFPDKKSEILFFKKIKPSVCSKIIYYQAVFDLESIRMELDTKSVRKYFRREQKRILKYMKDHKVKVQYYRCGHCHLDEKYFLRDNKEIPLEVKDSHSLMDENFFSWHDHTFSTIMANEMLLEYIKNEMKKLDHSQGDNLPQSNLKWTGNKIDVQELLYAIYFDGSVNDGKATIKELAESFEWMFNIELQEHIYGTPEQLVKRADPVKYLTHLMTILKRRIYNKLR